MYNCSIAAVSAADIFIYLGLSAMDFWGGLKDESWGHRGRELDLLTSLSMLQLGGENKSKSYDSGREGGGLFRSTTRIIQTLLYDNIAKSNVWVRSIL